MRVFSVDWLHQGAFWNLSLYDGCYQDQQSFPYVGEQCRWFDGACSGIRQLRLCNWRSFKRLGSLREMCCLNDALQRHAAFGHRCGAGWSHDRLNEKLMDDCFSYDSSDAGSTCAEKLGTSYLRSLMMLQKLWRTVHLS